MGSMSSGSMETYHGSANAVADDFGLGAMETIQQKQESAVAALNMVNSMRQEQRVLNVTARVNGNPQAVKLNKNAAQAVKIENNQTAGGTGASPRAKAYGLFSLEGANPSDPQFTHKQAELQEESEDNVKEIERVNKKNRKHTWNIGNDAGDSSGDGSSESSGGESGSGDSGSGGN